MTATLRHGGYSRLRPLWLSLRRRLLDCYEGRTRRYERAGIWWEKPTLVNAQVDDGRCLVSVSWTAGERPEVSATGSKGQPLPLVAKWLEDALADRGFGPDQWLENAGEAKSSEK